MTTMNRTSTLYALALAGFATINTACTVLGPDYVRPPMNVPAAYKETSGLTTPQTRNVSADEHWWALYGDSQLNELIVQVEPRNYSLQAMEARVRQAQSLTDAARAAQYPTLSCCTNLGTQVTGGLKNLGLLASWEIDLWGRIRRNIEASGATAQASAADLAAATLSLQTQLAQNHFLLRVQDAEIRLLRDTVTSYEQSLRITRNQHSVGVASRDVIMQAQAQLGAAQAQMLDARVARAKFEHAIAVLIGKAPADFSFAVAPIGETVPIIPSALPSDLLERRPDIAAAERRMAAASAQIGVAEAAAYPSISLFAGVSIRRGVGGATVSVPILGTGAVRAQRTKAEAAYDEAVANYRQAVLDGFREVEDNLAVLQILDEAATAQSVAVKAARESAAITYNQYRNGIVNYQSVIMAQTTTLGNERAALNMLGRRLVASVTLIKALGGGWDSAKLKEIKK